MIIEVKRCSLKTRKEAKTFHIELDGQLSPSMTKKAVLFVLNNQETHVKSRAAIQPSQQNNLQQAESTCERDDSKTDSGDSVRDRDKKRQLNQQLEEQAQAIGRDQRNRVKEAEGRVKEAEGRVKETRELLGIVDKLERVNRLRSTLQAQVPSQTATTQGRIEPETVNVVSQKIE